MRQYVRGNANRDSIEKSAKKFVLLRQERLVEEKEKSRKTEDLEEIQVIDTKDQEEEKTPREEHKRSVQPPLSEIATKLQQPYNDQTDENREIQSYNNDLKNF